MHSALYTGQIRHRRFAPCGHAFAYRLCMVWLDLAELDTVFRGRWLWSATRPTFAWLRRADYLGDPQLPLDQAVRDLVERETGTQPSGPIRLLTHLRTFGICFNPVSFYYCYDATDSRVETIVAEITNTPWKERHAYVLTDQLNESQSMAKRYRFDKVFHISPFIDMAITYDWRFTPPARHSLCIWKTTRMAPSCSTPPYNSNAARSVPPPWHTPCSPFRRCPSRRSRRFTGRHYASG